MFALAVQLTANLASALFLYIVPGLAILILLPPARKLDWGERLALAAGVSVAVYPILLLAAYVVGIAPGAALAWGPGGLGLLILLGQFIFRSSQVRDLAGRSKIFPRRPAGSWTRLAHEQARWAWSADHFPLLLLAITLLLLLAVRMASVADMAAPAWGDSVHHTFIVQLLLDHGGLFQSWEPYAPIASLTYHFGFHVNAAVWAWLTGLDAPASVIAAGQMLNVLAVLVLYPLGKRLGGSAWAGLMAVVVAGFLFPMPGFYVNWGRYTQLAGQIILLPALWLLDRWWREPKRPPWPTLALISLLLLGLVLTHYRVIILMGAAGVAWSLWGIWIWRAALGEWAARLGQLILAGGVAGFLFLPWLQIMLDGRLARIAAGILAAGGAADTSAEGEMAMWRYTATYFPDYFWMLALAALVLALVWRRTLALPLILWAGVSFLLTNPHIAGLPGTGIVSNFALIIALYIPIGLLLGWVAGSFLEKFSPVVWQSAGGATLLIAAIIIGMPQQLRVVDPFYQMVTQEDLQTFAWINTQTPPESRFLVNGLLVYGESAAVGTDAGWWLTYYTRRASTIPPITYLAEALAPGMGLELDSPRRITADVRASQGDPAQFQAILCREGITHIFLGQRRGNVAFGTQELIPEAWLVDKPHLTLAMRTGQAEVWAFDRESCGGDSK